MRGRFVTLEGLEGTGKSTQLSAVHAWLKSQGIDPVVTREPGGTALGEKLRELVLQPGADAISPSCELLIMFAARAAHLDNVIRPALARGQWVLCDRFTDASFAYQGAGRGVAEEHLRALQKLVQDGLQPDLTLLLDAPLEVGLERARQRRGQAAADRFEREGVEFFQRVRTRFLRIAAEEPERVKVVNAQQPLERVTQDLIAHLRTLLP